MANNKSSLKRIRQSIKRRLYNKYYIKTLRTQIKKFFIIKDKNVINIYYIKLISMIDKLSNKGIIHKNNAANKKSKVTLYLNNMLYK